MRAPPQVVRLGMNEGVAAIQREIAEHGTTPTPIRTLPLDLALALALALPLPLPLPL